MVASPLVEHLTAGSALAYLARGKDFLIDGEAVLSDRDYEVLDSMIEYVASTLKRAGLHPTDGQSRRFSFEDLYKAASGILRRDIDIQIDDIADALIERIERHGWKVRQFDDFSGGGYFVLAGD